MAIVNAASRIEPVEPEIDAGSGHRASPGPSAKADGRTGCAVPGDTLLTRRELQILELVAFGLSAKEVAKQCAITPRTVEAHLNTARLKLRARNRVHMVAIALDRNLLPNCRIRLERLVAA